MDRWLQLTVEIPSAALPVLESVLEEAGCFSITLTDPGGEPILEPAPESTPLWDRFILTALLPGPTSAEQVSAMIAQATAAFGHLELSFEEIADRDWVGDWREQLTPRRFGGALWICPTDSVCPEPGAAVVVLDPGLAFGTGNHPTTAMCLEWLAGQDLRGSKLLDFGCGSGLLAIAALMMGAATATAVDIDPQALAATRANAVRNGCTARLHVTGPASLPAQAGHDVIVANILSGILIKLAPRLARLCRAGARIALSGILSTQGRQVIDACAPWFDLLVAHERDGWLLITGVATPRR